MKKLGTFTKIGLWVDSRFNKDPEVIKNKKKRPALEAGLTTTTWSTGFDGEKTVGELGKVRKYYINYPKLRERSWQYFLESDIMSTIAERFTLWVVKNGLRLQLSPVTQILEENGVRLDAKRFSKSMELRYKLWADSKQSTKDEDQSFNQMLSTIFKMSIVGGDVLVILWVENGRLKVQTVDGAHLTVSMLTPLVNGNRVSNGVEYDQNKKHVAYHINTDTGVKRITAYDEATGLRKAFLVYGNKFRVDEVRGYPIGASSIESISKIDGYKDASLSKAEEINKVAYTIEHDKDSTGENPLTGGIASIVNGDGDDDAADQITPYEDGNNIAQNITQTMQRETINLPIGAKLQSLESKHELFFKDFFSTNANIVCAAWNIPPNVAFSLYTESYSSSRAAIKDWENTLDFNRKKLQAGCLDYVLEMFMYLELWSSRVIATGFINAIETGNQEVRQAFINAKFIGVTPPHIDPVKEAKALRIMAGSETDSIPFATLSELLEKSHGGDYNETIDKVAEELEEARKLGLIKEDNQSTEDSSTT